MPDTDRIPLHRYRSHGIVRAAEILRVESDALWIEQADGDAHYLPCEAAMFARYTPTVGDYVVFYPDGFAAISPKKAFESGHTRLVDIDPSTGLGAGWPVEPQHSGGA
jgi:hypothetical protein